MPQDLDFHGRTVLVTGGALGIGRATVLAFAERGARVAVVDWNPEAGEEAARIAISHGGNAHYIRADVSSFQQAKAAVDETLRVYGQLHILVNNAGIQRYGTVTDCPEEVWDETLNVNLKGAFLMAKFAIPQIAAAGGGALVQVGSVQSVGAVGNSAAYVTAKHGLLGLTRSIALDYAPQNIRSYCVCPGAIDTPLLRWAAEQSPDAAAVLDACRKIHVFDRLGQPEEVARVIVFLASDMASFMTGSPVMVDGGLLVPLGGRSFQESGTGSR